MGASCTCTRRDSPLVGQEGMKAGRNARALWPQLSFWDGANEALPLLEPWSSFLLGRWASSIHIPACWGTSGKLVNLSEPSVHICKIGVIPHGYLPGVFTRIHGARCVKRPAQSLTRKQQMLDVLFLLKRSWAPCSFYVLSFLVLPPGRAFILGREDTIGVRNVCVQTSAAPSMLRKPWHSFLQAWLSLL